MDSVTSWSNMLFGCLKWCGCYCHDWATCIFGFGFFPTLCEVKPINLFLFSFCFPWIDMGN